MWPWEHAAVGYLLYSLTLRALGRGPPTGPAVGVLLVATLLPDLIDKTLSWGLGWFPTGYAVGHSALVAVPLGILAVATAWAGPYRRWADAFVLGYWSHLLGDVLSPLRYGNGILLGRILWPLSEQVPYETDYGLRRGVVYLQRFHQELLSTDPASVVILYLILPLTTIGLWLLDRAPGVRGPIRSLGRLLERER